MTLTNLMELVWRWIAVVLSIVIGTAVVLGWRLYAADPVYQAQVKLQLSAPQEENVYLFENYRSTTARDEIVVASNNFIEILKSQQVTRRVIEKLDLQGTNKLYEVEVQPLRDSDFIYITFQARTPQLAEAIANTHTSEAITYYGEIRAKPATATKNFLAAELATAEKDLRAAQEAFTQFKIEHGIGDLDNEISNHQSLISQLQFDLERRVFTGDTRDPIQATETLLEQLRLDRERAFARGDAAAVTRFDETIARYTQRLEELRQNPNTPVTDTTIITAFQDRLARLITLQPTYTDLQSNVEQARANYDLLRDAYREAVIKENTVKTASFIQIVEPAVAPLEPAPGNSRALFILGVIGSLGLGLMTALLLDSLSGVKTPRRTAAPGALANTTK